MICTSRKPKKDTQEKILEKIRNLDKLKLDIKVNDYLLSFNEQTGDWKSI